MGSNGLKGSARHPALMSDESWDEAKVSSYLQAGWTADQLLAHHGDSVSPFLPNGAPPRPKQDDLEAATGEPQSSQPIAPTSTESVATADGNAVATTSAVIVTEPAEEAKQPLADRLMIRFGIDIRILSKRETWVAFGIAALLFTVIGYSSLSLFERASDLYGTSDDIRPTADFEVETVNRSWIEQGPNSTTNSTGWFTLSEHQGEVVIIDFMAIACANCHYVQEHIDLRYDEWTNLSGPYPVTVISIGSWYDLEDLDDLDEHFGTYCREWNNTGGCTTTNPTHMPWTVATSTATSAIDAENSTRRTLEGAYAAHVLPVVVVLDHEGYVVARESTGTPLDAWSSFDDAVQKANVGEAESLRIGLREETDSRVGIFVVGLLMGVLVYFSPCAFPILPSYITYYINLGVREEELRDAGKLKGRLPGHLQIGSLAALGQFTFFATIGIIVYGLSAFIDLTPHLAVLAKAIAVLLIILGAFMLLGGTAHLLGWIQKIISRYQTTEADDTFTPRRNMYLWGIGYSAASSDCTAAAVLPFIGYLAIFGGSAVVAGLAGIILSASLLMIGVTVAVGLGRQALLARLRAATGLIKSAGAWMMMMAGIGLLVYLTQTEIIAGIIA